MADHQPVLVKEALEGLAVRRDGWYVDCTYGRGGHTRRILAELGERGRLMALDKDGDAVQHARAHFGDDPRFAVRCSGFEDFRAQVGPWLGTRRLAGVLFDLGISSAQLDAAQRGFSFSQDGPLDMRLNTTEGLTAQQWLRHVEEAELAGVLRRFGEEPAHDGLPEPSSRPAPKPRSPPPGAWPRWSSEPADRENGGFTLRHGFSRRYEFTSIAN